MPRDARDTRHTLVLAAWVVPTTENEMSFAGRHECGLEGGVQGSHSVALNLVKFIYHGRPGPGSAVGFLFAQAVCVEGRLAPIVADVRGLPSPACLGGMQRGQPRQPWHARWRAPHRASRSTRHFWPSAPAAPSRSAPSNPPSSSRAIASRIWLRLGRPSLAGCVSRSRGGPTAGLRASTHSSGNFR